MREVMQTEERVREMSPAWGRETCLVSPTIDMCNRDAASYTRDVKIDAERAPTSGWRLGGFFFVGFFVADNEDKTSRRRCSEASCTTATHGPDKDDQDQWHSNREGSWFGDGGSVAPSTVRFSGTKADSSQKTNGSSIVSKRSVERIYYDEPHFFRHFVKTAPRRAPLVNRGYWLRMYALEQTVKQFLEEDTCRPKLVINFGCGFDPLLFQLLSREPKLCADARFIDIDHRKLMLEKWDTIQNTPELTELVPDAAFVDQGHLLIQGRQYIGIGCDLGNLVGLEDAIKSVVDPSRFSIICTAEVCLTYMEVRAADALIAWAGKLSDDTQFALLEQFLPDGPEHPFAKTMIAHFTKWKAPLQSIHVYPTLAQQEQRFTNSAWKEAHARSLWSIWSDSRFISPETRKALDSFEAFDEWEDLALFTSHYFLLKASTRSPIALNAITQQMVADIGAEPQSYLFNTVPNFAAKNSKRFGAAFSMGPQIGFHAGLGQKCRLSSTDVYTSPDNVASPAITRCVLPETLPARMCHTITELDDGRSLLVGGRTSPSRALEDVWLFEKGDWHRSADLLTPCFRHSATAITLPSGDRGVLIYGGKLSTGEVTGQFAIWMKVGDTEDWTRVPVEGTSCPPRFGAMISTIDRGKGVIFGGMSQDGLVLSDFWSWHLLTSDNGHISLQLRNESSRIYDSQPRLSWWVSRFGATTHSFGSRLVVIGGISIGGCVPHEWDVVTLDLGVITNEPIIKDTPLPLVAGASPTQPRPLLIGHSSLAVGNGKILILGGGAVCFGFGSYWNKDTWLLSSDPPDSDSARCVVELASSSATGTSEIEVSLSSEGLNTIACIKN